MNQSTPRFWSAERDALLDQLFPSTPWAEMQKTLQTSRASIKMRALRLGLKRELTSVKQECKKCGIPFTIFLSRSEKGWGVYCSDICRRQAWTDGEAYRWVHDSKKIDVACTWCGTQLSRWPWENKNSRPFCSYHCSGAQSASDQGGRASKLEIDFGASIHARGFMFETQLRVDRFSVDIAFPSIKLAVEVDGDYWHSFPRVVEKDKRKDIALAKEGWVLMRVKEKDMRISWELCVDRVINKIIELGNP